MLDIITAVFFCCILGKLPRKEELSVIVEWLIQESADAMHLTIWFGVLVWHQYDVCKNMLAVCMLVGMVV